MKKFFSIFMSIAMVFSLCMITETSVFAEEKKLSDDIAKVIENYYIHKDTGISERFKTTEVILSNDVKKFILGKIDTQQYVTELYNTDKENYDVDVVLLEEDDNATFSFFKFQVITEFNYIGLSEKTNISEEVCVAYDTASDKIIDIYTPSNYYDMEVRGTDRLDSSFKTNKAKKFSFTESIEEKQASIIDNINNVYNVEISAMTNKINSDKVMPRSSTINRTNVVNWANKNYNKSQPSSGNGTVPYYDFSNISGNYDCTNFVSHALLAGGAKVNDTGGSGISSTGWYYRSLSNRSSAWSGVVPFYNYMSTSTTANKASAKGQTFTYTNNGAYWGKGSVLQVRPSGSSSYTHSTIITIKKDSNDGTRSYAYVTGRTSKTSYNYNQAVSDMSPSGTKRVMNVYNY